MGTPTAPLGLTLKGQIQGHSYFITRKRAILRHMLLLNIDRKPYIGSPVTLSDLERSNSNSRFQTLVYLKGA